MGSSNFLLAEPKTYTKDETTGRVLIYRAASHVDIFYSVEFGVAGICLIMGYLEGIRGRCERFCGISIGSVFTTFGLWRFKRWYYNYTLLHKPFIIIDKLGIVIEGKGRIVWKKLVSYRSYIWNEFHAIEDRWNKADWEDTLYFPEDYLKINTETNEFKIYSYDLAITIRELKELIDEAYAEYKKSLAEQVTQK